MRKRIEWMEWNGTDFWTSRRVVKLSESANVLYRWLIDWQWTNGPIPDDLGYVQRLYPYKDSLPDAWGEVRQFFDVVDGHLVNARVERQYQEALARIERKSAAGRASAAAREERYGTPAPGPRKADSGTALEQRSNGCSNSTGTPNPTVPNPTNPERGAKRRAAAPWVAVLAAEHPGLPAAAWGAVCQEWADYRRRRRIARVDELGWRTILANAAPHGLDVFRADVGHSIASTWKSINPAPVRHGSPPPAPKSEPRRETPEQLDIRERWERRHTHLGEIVRNGVRYETVRVDTWPGYEAASAELDTAPVQ